MRILPAICAGLLLFASVTRVKADILAADNASDPAYADGWQGVEGAVEGEIGEDNGGFGFGPWRFSNTYWVAEDSPYATPHFVDTTPSIYNALGAPAFAMTNGNVAYAGYTSVAARSIDAPLEAGHVFSVDVDNPLMQQLDAFDNTGFIIKLSDAAGTERLGLYTYFGFNNNEWTITDELGGEGVTGFTDVDGSEGFNYAVKYLTDDYYEMTITPHAGGEPLVLSGGLANFGAGPISNVEFVLYGNGSDLLGGRELYINNLQVSDGDAAQAGDTDADGDVDIIDLNNVRNNFGVDNAGIGDTDGDADVDIEDLNAVRNNFGAGSDGSPTPEPSTMLLALMGLAGGAWRFRQTHIARRV